MYKVYTAILFIIYLFTGNNGALFAQNQLLPASNKINNNPQTSRNKEPKDTNKVSQPDTSKTLLNDPIDYTADDSLLFSIDNKKVFLYGNANIKYQKLELTAAYIELDMDQKTVYAIGMPDSAGKIVGNPVFKDGKETFEAKEMHYNFNTKKGVIKQVITKQSNGYLHAEKTKREANTEINMMNGKYTTCDLEHPHYYIALTRAKAIPNDKIVSGPAYLVIEDVPIYFPLLPFGFFPNHKGHTSGFIIPEYGEEQIRGFFLRNGGYYFAINDYIDYQLTGDFYTKGTWGTSSRLTYRKRYRYSGAFNFRYYSNATGDRDIPGSYTRSTDFSITWNHTQDSKANPYNRFSANVNYSTSTFNQNQARNPDLSLSSTQSSNISFSKNWPNKPFNFSMNVTHNQNNQTGEINFTAPSAVFNVSRQYPFRHKNRSGKLKWYENIEVSYNASMENRLKTNDSMFINHFKLYQLDTGRSSGFKHDIPIRTNFKILNFLNVSPSLNYSGRIFSYKMQHDSTWNGDHYYHYYKPVPAITYAHGYYPSLSISANPTLYGMYVFKKGSKVQAIRHVIDPTIGFSIVPNMPELLKSMNLKYPNYYESRVDTSGHTINQEPVSIFQTGYEIYNTPTFSRSSGGISFSLRNNVEMKVRTNTDTAEVVKKIKIIDNLIINTGYNLFAYKNSPRWAPFSISTSNRFFKDKININPLFRAFSFAIFIAVGELSTPVTSNPLLAKYIA